MAQALHPKGCVWKVLSTHVTDRANPAAEHGPDNFACFAAETQSDAPQQVSYNFSGMDLQDLLVVEICAGSARLTKTVRSRGMRGLAVDKTKGRSCGTEIMLLDLTVKQGLTDFASDFTIGKRHA